jgi:hypothetical protein
MVPTPLSRKNKPIPLPIRYGWLSLYPHLSAKGKHSLLVLGLGAAVLAQSIGFIGSPAASPFRYANPAVQNALSQLGLSAPAESSGGQFQVNSYTTGDQKRPSIALDNDGDFVVVWQSNGSPGSDSDGYSIQGQRYDSAGVPQGSQFQVNSYTSNNQLDPAVAMDSDGDFVVVWASYGSSGGDTDEYSIQGQRYDSAGIPQGSQFQINSYTTDGQRFPDVSLDDEGDFVVVWTSNGSSGSDSSGYSTQGQRYNSAGIPQGSNFQVNSYTTGVQISPAVALDSDGDFVVTWTSNGSYGSDSDYHSIQGQRYNSIGVPQGSQFQVNSFTTLYQQFPAVALDSDGDFVVTWTSYGSDEGDTHYESVQGQRYNSLGVPQGSQFQVNSFTTNPQRSSAVAIDSDGDFVVTWYSNGSYGSDNEAGAIQGQRYNSAGTPQGGEFQINSYTANDQDQPDIALDSDGDFVVVWQSNGSGSDHSGHSILGQRYGTVGPTPTPTALPTHTLTPDPTSTSTPTPSTTPINTPTSTSTPAPSVTPTDAPTLIPTATSTPDSVESFIFLPAVVSNTSP